MIIGDNMQIVQWQGESLDEVKRIYEDAFPKKERLPFSFLKRRIRKERAKLFIMEENGRPIAFAYLILFRDMFYLFYFAVISERRSCGIGTCFTKELLSRYKNKRFFLALEQPQNDVGEDDNVNRQRRKQFYINNGFLESKCKIKESDIIFDVMYFNKDISREEYSKMFKFWGGQTFSMFMKIAFIE